MSDEENGAPFPSQKGDVFLVKPIQEALNTLFRTQAELETVPLNSLK